MNINPTMRVGYVLKRYPRYSETFIINEILAHEASGLDIEIFSLLPPTDTHFQNVISQVRAPVNYLPYAGIKAMDFWSALEEASYVLPGFWSALKVARGENHRDVYQAAVLAKAVRLNGINLLHAHFATSATAVARLASFFSDIPYTFTAHAKDIFHEEVEHDDLHKKLTDAKSVVTVSNYNIDFLKENYGSAAERVVRIYNGLNPELFPNKNSNHRQTNIIAVGRLVEKKGFADLIEACAILFNKGLQFSCMIIGTGTLDAELSIQIERLGLEDTVKLVGPRPQNEVVKHIQDAMVFAAPCVIGSDGNRDGLPTVLLEAMALGTPCVSTDVTGIPEVIRHGETGLMVPQHNPDALADAVENLFVDTSLRVKLATNARHLFESEFDVSKNAAQMRRVFKQAVNSNPDQTREISQ